ncbi:MAG TPA: LPS export ABC transporter permease LptG [Gammaproteobacteria bacterium]|jgi:lipopolysaccharide export system permease protein|nr:LPS export ABC transporter permease LptG [Gammaproteobacteria bacterium]
MFKLLERYITKTIILATGLTALIMGGVLFLLLLLGELKRIGEGDYSILQAFLYALLRLPGELYQFSPMLVLLGSIIGLSLLSAQREIAVMRTAGFSVRRIMFSVLGAAMLLVVGIGAIGEGLTPNLNRKAEVQKENAKNAGQSVVTSAGVWLHIDNNFIHVQQVVGRQLLENVTRYQFDDQHRLQAAYFAKTLTYQNNHWQMNEGKQTIFHHERTESQSFTHANWDLPINPNLLNVAEAHEMSLTRLAKFIKYLKQNSLQATEYQYQFWQRIFQPLAALIMIFLAVPFVLGTINAASLSWRILVGIMLGFGFFISNALLGQLSIVYQIPPMLAAALPLVLFVLIGIILVNRMMRY